MAVHGRYIGIRRRSLVAAEFGEEGSQNGGHGQLARTRLWWSGLSVARQS